MYFQDFFSFHSKLSRPLESDIIKHCKYEGVKEQTIQLYKPLAHLLLPMVYFFNHNAARSSPTRMELSKA